MLCPHCGFEGEPVRGGCARCGYSLVSAPANGRGIGGIPASNSGQLPTMTSPNSGRSPNTPNIPGTPSSNSGRLSNTRAPIRTSTRTPNSGPLPGRYAPDSDALSPIAALPARNNQPQTADVNTLMRGDVLHQGRYRLVEQLSLPANQQKQGIAWLATDAGNANHRVVIREMKLPERPGINKEQIARSVGLRLSQLGEHSGIPRVLDMFDEKGNYYLVIQYIEGEPLSSLLKRQGGALPERVVAEYGRQLSEILSFLANVQPPLVHGAVNPDTIIISPDKKRVSLIHLPLFAPVEAPVHKGVAGYFAPEQARGNVELSSDIYGLGATLHHAVTGYDPRERMAFFHPPARRLNPAVTPEMEAMLSQALRLSASQRYAHATDMQKELTSLIASYPPEIVSVPSQLNPMMNLSSAELRQRSRRRNARTAGITGAISVLILLAILLLLIRPTLNSTFVGSPPNLAATATSVAEQAALNKELALESQLFQKKGIGMSDGRFVFDTYGGRQKDEVNFKQQAAQAMQKGDLSTAVNTLNKAVTLDPTDGEAQIYNENVHILQSGAPYLTIVLGVPIDKNAGDLFIARANMQSSFLIQHQVNKNQQLPHGLQLRILIDNSGESNNDVGAVAQFIQNRVLNAGNIDHIIAVVGWPFSSQTTNAESIIAAAHIPLISQTASSVSLSGSSPYFFRVNPPDNLQGSTLGKVAVQSFSAKNILVLRDPTDTYSKSLADAFTASVQKLGAKAINNSAYNFTEGVTTVAQYRTLLRNVFSTHVSASSPAPDLIFIAGLDIDAVPLANALGIASRENPTIYPVSLKILGGDAIDTGVVLGQGDPTDPNVALAKSFPQDMQRLNFTAFGHPSEWQVEHMPKPQFFTNWSNTYQNSPVASNNALDPGNDAILTYDVYSVILKAISLTNGSLTGQAVRDAIASLGHGNVPALQGISGRILFDSQGNPVDKAVVVLGITGGPNGNSVTLKQVAGTFK